MRTVCRLLKAWFATMFLTSAVYGATTGTIRGTVLDQGGAVLTGAQVTVTNEGTNETRSMSTDAAGTFQFLLLPVGNYTLQIQRTGFKEHLLRHIPLLVNQVASFTPALQVGSLETKVTVEANPVQVDTVSTQVGTVISSKPIVDLPLNGRNVYQLVALQPGITVPGGADQNDPSFGFTDRSPLVFSSGGGRATFNNFMVDGADTNGLFGNQAVIRIIPDAVEEFRVLTNTYNAEFGRNAGSVVNIVSKSGTNSWHGGVFEFLRNEALNARGFFEPEKAPFKLNQFGGSVGGPVIKNKTFLFASYQGTRQRKGANASLVPVFSDAARNGDFSARNPSGFLDPTTGSPRTLSNDLCFPRDSASATNCFPAGTSYDSIFPNAMIPTSFFDPVSQTVLGLIPRPNVGPDSLSISPVQPDDSNQWTLKLDHQINAKHKLAGFYFFDDNFVTDFAVGGNMPGFPGESAERDQQIALTETWIASPQTLNEFRIAYLRQARAKEDNPLHTASPSSFGFVGIQTGEPAAFQSLPVIAIDGGPEFQAHGGGSGGGTDFQNVLQFGDQFSRIMGRHTLKLGGDYRRIQYLQKIVYIFDGDFFFGGGGPNSTGDPFADFVLGLPDTYFQGGIAFERLRTDQVNIYGQDTWRIRPNLTLNYGLRWELNTPFVEKDNAIETFRSNGPSQPLPQSKVFPTAPPGLLFPGDPGVPRSLTRTYYRAFGPRIGLAYSPNWLGANKLVIRSAYGIFYNPIEQGVLLQFNGDVPYAGNSVVTSPGFANPFTDQSGALKPSPFPFVPPQPGQPIDFGKFLPILEYGDFLPEQRSQYVEQYNLMLEYQLSRSIVVGGGYVGSQGHRLLASFDLNPGSAALCTQINAALPPPPPGGDLPCGPFTEDTTYQLPNGQTIYGTRPLGPLSNNGVPGPDGLESFTSLFAQHPIANSTYHSAQLRLERRSADLEFLASYTFSKSLDNASGFENLLNPFCYTCDRSLSSFDARHRFVFSYTYDLPWARKMSSNIGKKVLDGWEVGGIYTYQSGLPIHFTDSGSDNSLTGGYDFETADRPDVVGPIRILDPHHSGLFYFDTNSFAFEQPGKIGNVTRNYFAGPPTNNWDFTLIKHLNFTERYQWEFRAEFFNFLNHTQFLNPDGDISGDFGHITRARDPRFIQFGTKLSF